MEKAMHAAHGVCYEEYCSNHDVRMAVEREREKDYLKSQRILSDIERKAHS
ncbi:hypothetical protein [Mesobacillus foraminis]|nr:hypothetical protein [Mesobacillus foraminis]